MHSPMVVQILLIDWNALQKLTEWKSCRGLSCISYGTLKHIKYEKLAYEVPEEVIKFHLPLVFNHVSLLRTDLMTKHFAYIIQ